MYSTEVQIRVRYAEVDQMGTVYYGNYATYYEIARVEALRRLGISYKEVEAQGIFMPVIALSIRYVQPARYDELLTIRVCIPECPRVRMPFHYKVWNEQKILLQTGKTILVFVNKESGKPVRIPAFLEAKLASYFKESQASALL